MNSFCHNEYEIRIFGMRRSGNHMLTDWIASLFDQPVYFFNNCRYFNDPLRTNFIRTINPHVKRLYCNIPIMAGWEEKDVQPIRECRKECLLLSYEESNLLNFEDKDVIENRQDTIKDSEMIFDILIIRDFFNWTASRLYCESGDRNCLANKTDKIKKARPDDNEWMESAKTISRGSFLSYNRHSVTLWKIFAREFLNETHYLKQNKIPISYNKFVSDEKYRKQIARKIGRNYQDWTLNELGTMYGNGSSFEKNTKLHNAERVKVLERWKTLKDNVIYRELINEDKEAIELSERVFGHVSGTEYLLD